MGGVVSLGYRVETRALQVVEDHSAIVHGIFRRYLACGSVVALKADLDAENIRLPIRIDGAGRQSGGGSFSRGHLYKILSNPVYIGRLAHKGLDYAGQHAAIVDQQTWKQTQDLLTSHALPRRNPSRPTCALLAGKLFDDRGFRMSPIEAAKGAKRWRYYVSQAILQGCKQDAGSLPRISAPPLERAVLEAVRAAAPGQKPSDDAIRTGLEKVVAGKTSLTIRWRKAENSDGPPLTLSLPWSPTPTRRQREILQGDGAPASDLRPMRIEARRAFAVAYGKARFWLDLLTENPKSSIQDIADREQRKERSIRQTLSLAFLDPVLVAAALDPRLPRGFGLKRLMDLPSAWSEQWVALGLRSSSTN